MEARFELNALAHIPLGKPLSHQAFDQWLDQGLQADMDYLKDSREVRKNPREHFKPMTSVLLATQEYFPMPDAAGPPPFQALRMAHYARGKDYHFWFREKLNQMVAHLKKKFPEEEFLCFTDAVPFLERDFGAQAALGWIGKNTCLIHPKKGSLFFIGEILTTLKGPEETPPPLHDFCGKCRACIDVCPTDALDESRRLDANKCLAFWNIESKKTPPLEIREKMDDWFFGCDLCQTACPWNMKLFKDRQDFEQVSSPQDQLVEELRFILQSSNKQLMRTLKETPLSRAGGRGLKRNAMIVIANKKLGELKTDVRNFEDHPQLGELARWTLSQIV